MLLFTACSPQHPTPPTNQFSDEMLSQIQAIDLHNLSNHILPSNIAEEIFVSDEAFLTSELPEGTSEKFETKLRYYDLSYMHTAFYPFDGGYVRYYKITNTDEGTIGLCGDGSLFACYRPPITPLNIARNASSETVLEELKSSISDLIDFSKYEDVEVFCNNSDEEPFLAYTFHFSHRQQGYLVDYASVDILNDGTILRIWRTPTLEDAENICKEIDKELEEAIIQAKLKQIFDRETLKYQSHISNHDSAFDMYLISYNNEVCIAYTLDCVVYLLEEDCEVTIQTRLAVPVRLIYATDDATYS